MKGINPLERHFEKLILALVALGLLAWVGADLMGVTAETVKMGGKQVTLDEIGGTLSLPKTRRIALTSVTSPAGVEVPHFLCNGRLGLPVALPWTTGNRPS